MTSLFQGYSPLERAFDELFAGSMPRPEFETSMKLLGALDRQDFERMQRLAERVLLNQGVTFSVYSDDRGTEKIFPFCLIPRLISARDFKKLRDGIEQRLRAMEAFLDDIYGDQRILEEGVIPREMVLGAAGFRKPMVGVAPKGRVRIHVAGIDLIRDGEGVWRVLEDNLRCPSGVSYVLENRLVSKRLFPQVLRAANAEPVNAYPTRLADALGSLVEGDDPCIVVLTPGPFNSAYFEHSFLARTMGVELVQAPDLYVENDCVYLATTRGPRKVDVIYRRTDDDFIDPEVFRPDSALGVKGVMRAYRAGNVILANAPGNSIADDKAIYPFVPDMVKFYLSEDAILDQVPTWVCARDDDRKFVVDHLDELVVKSVDEAGGYGMLMGPTASKEEREDFRARILSTPRKYVAQRRIELSTCPTWIEQHGETAPRRIDLRPYAVTGAGGTWVLPGGLTRVAKVEGSYVVNSSQGGGSKDTWVLREGSR